MYEIVADLHMHSIASTHAYSTIAEMVAAAARKGLYAVAITDHGHKMPGAPGPWFFECQRHLPLIQQGVKVLSGMETNIIDFNGTIDYEVRDNVNLVIASIHNIWGFALDNPTVEKCTQLYLNVAQNPHVHIIGHSGTPDFAYDYELVIPAFGKAGKLVEINAHSFDVRAESVANCKKIAALCKKHCVPIVVNSDAHFHTEVGYFDNALKMLEELDFPEELIVNGSVPRLEAYLAANTNIITNRTF